MTTHDIKESKRHNATAVVLTILGAVFLFVAGITFAFSLYSWTVIFIVVVMVFGNNAFNHFEKASELKPPSPIIRSLELFSAPLKHGNPCSILVDLQYPIEDDQAHNFDRIRALLQRGFNVTLLEIEQLPSNPYPFIDDILGMQEKVIANELQLTGLHFKAVDIKTAVTESAPGIFLRSN